MERFQNIKARQEKLNKLTLDMKKK
jgi:hypothetical protein